MAQFSFEQYWFLGGIARREPAEASTTNGAVHWAMALHTFDASSTPGRRKPSGELKSHCNRDLIAKDDSFKKPNVSETPLTRRRSNMWVGVSSALVAQCLWGVFPLYLKLLAPTDVIEIVGHRVVWSFGLLVLLVMLSSSLRVPGLPRWRDIRSVFAQRQTLLYLVFAALLILGNWMGFVAAIRLGRELDASVGYYICPQVVVLLGVIFQKEELSRAQWFAFACTSLGVLAMSASTSGIPWLGLLVAFSFGFYALLKKRIECAALISLTFETGILFLPAAGFLIFRTAFGPDTTLASTGGIVSAPVLNLLLVLLGVATVVPLAMYVDSVKRLPLSMAGLLQFVGPTIQFCLSIFVFGDNFDWPRVIGILLVWTGVILYLRAMRLKGAF